MLRSYAINGNISSASQFSAGRTFDLTKIATRGHSVSPVSPQSYRSPTGVLWMAFRL